MSSGAARSSPKLGARRSNSSSAITTSSPSRQSQKTPSRLPGTPSLSFKSRRLGHASTSPLETSDVESDFTKPAPRSRASHKLTILYSLGLLITGVGNSVYFKRMTNHMPNYPFFLSQVINVVYVPIFYLLVEYELHFTRFITRDMLRFPKYKFLLMGAADALAGVLMLFGGVYTAGSVQVLLNNAVIPVTMLLSVIMLRRRFSNLEYIGALTIVTGVLCVLYPTLKNSDDTSNNFLVFNGLFLASALPSAFSAVYKELALRDIEMDVNYLQAWVAYWQLLIGLLLIPLNCFEFLGSSYVPWSGMGKALSNGWWCLMGYNSITTNCRLEDSPLSSSLSLSLPPCDACAGSWLPVTLYLAFNIAQSVFVVLVIKHGSASLMYLMSTLKLPLVQLVFALPFLSAHPEPLPLATLFGMAVTLVGLVAYRWPQSSVPLAPSLSSSLPSTTTTTTTATSSTIPVRKFLTLTPRRAYKRLSQTQTQTQQGQGQGQGFMVQSRSVGGGVSGSGVGVGGVGGGGGGVSGSVTDTDSGPALNYQHPKTISNTPPSSAFTIAISPSSAPPILDSSSSAAISMLSPLSATTPTSTTATSTTTTPTPVALSRWTDGGVDGGDVGDDERGTDTETDAETETETEAETETGRMTTMDMYGGYGYPDPEHDHEQEHEDAFQGYDEEAGLVTYRRPHRPKKAYNTLVFGGGGSGSGQIDLTVALRALWPTYFSTPLPPYARSARKGHSGYGSVEEQAPLWPQRGSFRSSTRRPRRPRSRSNDSGSSSTSSPSRSLVLSASALAHSNSFNNLPYQGHPPTILSSMSASNLNSSLNANPAASASASASASTPTSMLSSALQAAGTSTHSRQASNLNSRSSSNNATPLSMSPRQLSGHGSPRRNANGNPNYPGASSPSPSPSPSPPPPTHSPYSSRRRSLKQSRTSVHASPQPPQN